MAIGRVPVHIFDFDLIARESNAINRDDLLNRSISLSVDSGYSEQTFDLLPKP